MQGMDLCGIPLTPTNNATSPPSRYLFYLVTSRNFSPETWSEVLRRGRMEKLYRKHKFPHAKYDALRKKLGQLRDELSIIDSYAKEPNDSNTPP